jgi:hypothetical protein
MIFTPKKFIAMLELNDTNLTNLVNTKAKVYRSHFIPRYKEGTRRIKEISINYQKRINDATIEKIFNGLVELGIVKESDKEVVYSCFLNDNYDPLLPQDFL